MAVAAVRRAWDAGLLAYRPGEMAGRDAGVTDWRQGTGGIGNAVRCWGIIDWGVICRGIVCRGIIGQGMIGGVPVCAGDYPFELSG